MNEFKVGDRVRIVNLDGYAREERQGLFIGGVGTVEEVGPTVVFVATDAQGCRPHGSALGWAFRPAALEIVQ